MDSEEKLRQDAVQLFLENIPVGTIATKLSKSRQWVYKWISRYRNNPAREWYKDQSKVPKTLAGGISADIEHAIIEARKRLDSSPYSQKGAISILYELSRLGIQAPSVATINRVLKKNGFLKSAT